MEAMQGQKIAFVVDVGFGDSRQIRRWKIWARTPGEAKVAAQEKARWLLTVSVEGVGGDADDFDDEFDA